MTEKLFSCAVLSPAVGYLAHQKFRSEEGVHVSSKEHVLFSLIEKLYQSLAMLKDGFLKDRITPLHFPLDDGNDMGLSKNCFNRLPYKDLQPYF